MQNIQTNPSVKIPVETAFGRYSARQRFLSASLSLAVTSSVSAPVSMSISMTVAAGSARANERPAVPTAGGGFWGQEHGAGGNAFAHAAASQVAAQAAQPQALVNHGTFGISHAALNAAAHHSASQAAALSPAWHAAHSAVQALASQTAAAHDVNLNSAAALYAAGGLAGFHDLTLDIGGKQVQVFSNTKLTGAELVAAQQVLADGGQDIHLNARGTAVGGVFDMNAAAISAISDAVGGSIKSLYISRGVQAIDSLGNLNLLGNLVNMGSLVVGAAPSAANQTVDVISAANIYNGWGGSISSTSAVLAGLTPTDISLIATGVFFNAGNVSSAGNLNITAATITNTYAGLAVPTAATVPVLSAAQNVNLYTSSFNNNGLIAAGADINIINNTTANLIAANAGGTLQALNGNINFNAPDYHGAQGILATGGNWFSQQLNFNAGTGSIDANIDEVTGLINGTGSSSHITVSTANMNLGDICISGDPTYFNSNGDVTITGNLTGNPDLAIVASRNIIANGGSLDTSSNSGNGGTLTLIAGANFTTDGPSSNSSDTKTTLTITDSVNPGLGSKTGGYIDLSGIFLTGNNNNLAITSVTTASTTGVGGDVLMVAYAGTGKNAGSIVASEVPTDNRPGANAIDATGTKGGGDITILGAGSFLYGQHLYGGNIQILGGTPHISGGSGQIKILDGTFLPTGASYSQFGSTASGINVLNVVGDNVTIKTGGFVSTDLVIASGLGGSANGNGGDGGNVSITGSALFLSGVEATGGGGGGGNASQNGGSGGKGGNITLSAPGPIIIEDYSPAPGYLNVSGGGGGGGGGGGSATGAAGKGGAGGKAGTVTINTNSLFFAGGVLAADGAAGGDGGDGVVGTAGGGGGGGGGSFGGGGGGGAAGADATGTGSAVGGGGGAGFYEGGGGGAGATGKAVVTAGTGGSATGQFNPTPGLGGTIISGTGMAGTDGSANAGGAGGIPTGSGLTGGKGGQNGGATFGIGGGSDANAGKDGNEISTKTGSGIVNISVGAASGSLAEPIGIATPKLNLTGTTKNSALFLSGFSDYTEVTSAKFAGGTLNVLGGNGLTVNGPVSGADKVQLAAFGKLDVNSTVSGTDVSLQSFNNPAKFDGDINVGIGGLVLATNGTLTAENNIIANTQVSTLSVAAGGSSVTVNEAATASKALNLLNSFVGSGGTFTINSAQQINVTKGITAFNGTINLNETGTLSKIGINITSNLNVVAPFTGVKGTVNLSTTGGNASIINTVPITAIDLSINADGAVGSSSKAFATNVTGTLTVNGNSHDLISIKDANINAPTLTGKSTVFGQSISFVSAAKNLSVGNLGYTNVTLNNTFATAGGGATLTLNPTGNIANVIGDGFGTVSITTAAAEIDQGKTVTAPVILAKNLVLKTTAADVGGAGLGLSVSASSITASAAKGSVSIQDAIAASLGAGSALKTYNVSADGLTVAGAITGDVITLTGTGASGVVLNANVGATKSTTVNIIGGSGITQNSKAVATGLTVNLKANSSGDIGTAGQSILTKAGTTLTVVGSNNGQAFVKQTGSVAIGTSVGTGSSVLNLTGTGNLNIKGAVSFGAINLTAPVVEVFSGGGSLGTLNGLTVTAPVVKFDSGSTSIIAGGATFKSASGLAISGSDAALTVAGSLTLGGTVGGKQTTSITLGDAKTGANNPLATELNKTLSAITVNTTGNFTGSLQKIATDDTALGGKIDITAAKIVNVNAVPSLAPIVISADATAGPAGKVILNLTGTQSVSLGVGTVAKGDPQITISTSGGTGGGTVSVSSAGLLTVDNGGVAQSGTARNLTLIGAKGLSVTDANLLKTNLNSLTLSSGSTKAFTIGEGALPVNGTAGDIVASSVDINAGGGIVLAKTHTIAATVGSTFSNDTGALTITGDDKSITPGLALALSAKGAISLGDIKNGGINNPLSDIGNETLDSLSITAGGNFTGNYPVIALKPGGVMNITATNIVNVGSNPLAPIQLKAENSGGPAGSVILNLTGTQAITLGNLSVLKGQPQIQISVDGLVGGIVDVKTAGALTVNNGGVKFGSGLHDLTLSGGKGLSVTDTTLLNTNLGVVSLRSGATTPFVVGAAPASKDLLNGTAGDIKADSVSVTALKGITVAAASAITASGAGGSLTLDTTSLLNNGTISGKDAGSTLSFADSGKSNLGVSALGIGVYQNFGHVSFNTGGNVDLGNLFASGTTLATGLNSIDIQAGGSVTFASFLPTLNVAPGGSITVHAGSLVTKASTPIDFIATGSATIDISTKSALTLGAGKGTIALTVAPTGSDVTLVSTGGTLTVDTALSAGTIELRGSSVVVKQVVTAGSGDLTALAVGKTGTLTTVGSGLLVNSVGDVIVGQGSTKLAATPILVNTTSLLLGDSAAAGALNVSNSSGSASSVGGLVPIAGLSYNALKDISVDNISTTAGALTINTKGSLSTATGVTLISVGGGINLITSADPGNTIIIGKNNTITASSGSILIQNNNLVNGTISILSGVNILGSGTAKGVGQVSIVMGAVPAESALRPGVVPANTTIKSTGGAGVFFGSVAFPNDSIVANGSNILFAEGRNVVFATRGMGASTITINGGTITADPPAGAASSMAPATGLTGTTLGASVTAPTLTSGELRQSVASALPAIEPTSQIAPLPALTSALAASAQRFASMPGSLYAGYGPSASGNVTQYGVGAGSGGQGERRLERGAVLLTSDETTTVQTTFGSVTAAPGALALLVAFDGGVAVYNLHDDKKDAVVIRCGNRRVSVGPGRSTVITNRVGAKFEAVNPAHFVGYRRMSENDYGQGLKAFHSEFNTYSLMRGVDAIKKLIASDNPKERKIASAMLKTSAILLGLGNDQQFKLMLPPQMTAMIGNNTSR